MHPRLSQTLTLTVHRLQGYPLFDHLRALEQSQWWTQEKMREWQTGRVKLLLQHAARQIPYYRSLFQRIGFVPENFRSLDELKQLPFLTKDTVREQAGQLLDQRLRTEGLYYRKTSGSTGRPLKVAVEFSARAAWLAAKYRGMNWHGAPLGTKWASVWSSAPISASQRWINRFGNWVHNDLVWACNGKIDPSSAQLFYRRCLRFQPQALCGWPSALMRFADVMEDIPLEGRALKVKMLLTAGECLFPYQVERLQEVFGAPVISEYGCNEMGILAFMCEHRTYHLTAEHVYAEASLAADGIKQEIILTSLTNWSMPLIRYQLGDEVVFGKRPCSCGRGLPTLEKVVGRTADYLRFPGGSAVSTIELIQVIKQAIPIQAVKQVRFVQETLSDIFVEVATDNAEPVPEARDAIVRHLKAVVREPVMLQFRWLSDIPPDPSGKRSCLISRLSR